MKHVLRNIILGLPGDTALRTAQANAMRWFWTNRKSKDFKRTRIENLEVRHKTLPNDPVATLLLTAAK
jgi:hypothetical protein